ncbi:MAG TPA: hypothetical protein VGL65_03580 [Gemmatimonadales bacterium]
MALSVEGARDAPAVRLGAFVVYGTRITVSSGRQITAAHVDDFNHN